MRLHAAQAPPTPPPPPPPPPRSATRVTANDGGVALAELRTELDAARRQSTQDALVLEQSFAEAAVQRANAASLQEGSARLATEKAQALRALAAAHAAAERADTDAAAKLNSVIERLEHARGEVREHRQRSEWVPKSAATAAIPMPPSASRQLTVHKPAAAAPTPAPRRKPRSTTTRRESISVQTKTETREEFTLIVRHDGNLGVEFGLDPTTCLAIVRGAIDASGAVARDNPGEIAEGDRLESFNGEKFVPLNAFGARGVGVLRRADVTAALAMTAVRETLDANDGSSAAELAKCTDDEMAEKCIWPKSFGAAGGVEVRCMAYCTHQRAAFSASAPARIPECAALAAQGASVRASPSLTRRPSPPLFQFPRCLRCIAYVSDYRRSSTHRRRRPSAKSYWTQSLRV